MKHMLEKKQETLVRRIAACIFFALCYLGAVYLSYRTSAYILDSDAASPLILSKLLAEQGGILRESWFYSTELLVFEAQIVFTPLFKVFSDFRTVRVLGTALMIAGYALSSLFCLAQAGVRREYRLVCTGLLLLPVSVAYARIILMHTYSTPALTFRFLQLGLLFGMLRAATGSRRFYVYLTLYVLLGILTGSNGMLPLILTALPTAAVCVLLLFKRLLAARHEPDRAARRAAVKTSGELKAFWLSCVGVLTSLIGYAVYLFVLTPRYRVYDFWNETIFDGIRLWIAKPVFYGTLHLFGFREYCPLWSVTGILSLLGAMALVACLGLAVYWLFRKWRPDSVRVMLLGNLFLVSLVMLSAAMVLTNKTSFHYLIPATAFVPAMLAVAWEEGKQESRRWMRALCACVAAVFVGATFVTNHYLISEHSGEKADADSLLFYPGLSFQNIDITRELGGAADYLITHGFCYGYADYWNCNVLQEMTNGALIPICVEYTDGGPVYYDWMSDESYRENIQTAGPVYILMETDLAENDTCKAWLCGVEPAYADACFTVYTFSSNEELRTLLER